MADEQGWVEVDCGQCGGSGKISNVGYPGDFPEWQSECNMCSGTGKIHLSKEAMRVRNYGCFVATAVYGNIKAPEVEALRNIRDHVLLKSYFGRKFVEFYYSGAGEKAAEFIENEIPFTIPVIRKGLDFIVNSYLNK